MGRKDGGNGAREKIRKMRGEERTSRVRSYIEEKRNV